MFIHYGNYKSSLEFAMSLLKGEYDRQIFSFLYELAKQKGHRRFHSLDPTEYFIFDIEFTDENEFLDITSWNMNNCSKWDPDMSELERKAVMLMASIIRDKYAEVISILKYEKEDETNSRLMQV